VSPGAACDRDDRDRATRDAAAPASIQARHVISI
jgi:hypothetical protein